MQLRFRLLTFMAVLSFVLSTAAPFVLAQAHNYAPVQPPHLALPFSSAANHPLNDGFTNPNSGQSTNLMPNAPFANGRSMAELAEAARVADERGHRAEEEALAERRLRVASAQRAINAQLRLIQAHAEPDAPDQSELLKNSHDRDFILHNFKTMYVEAAEAQFFGSDQMKAALGRNGEFQKLGIRMVDDPRVADVVLKVSYTFAWDYPFELRHQNTTFVLLAGKGSGPFSGPLGAADVARQFVNAAKPWREGKREEKKAERK